MVAEQSSVDGSSASVFIANNKHIGISVIDENSEWTNHTIDIPESLYDYKIHIYSNYLYLIGGYDIYKGLNNDIYRLNLKELGEQVAWASMGSLPDNGESIFTTLETNVLFVNFVKGNKISRFSIEIQNDGWFRDWIRVY